MSTHLDPVSATGLVTGVFPDPEVDRYRSAGYGREATPGARPALLIVDVTYAFTGLPDGTGDYPLACGAAAWEAVEHIDGLASAAREGGHPVVYSRNGPRPTASEAGGWAAKMTSTIEPPRAHDIVDEISPREGDLVVTKTKPSAFFATPLITWLIQLGVDTLIVAGGSTSGCVRASVIDAFSYNLNPFVAAESTFDRSDTSHRVNLFEMSQKYATVVTTESAARYLAGS